ncbi:MAG TPA: YjgN family protein [Rhizomicrobium sp.]|jgi:uncharacterized membrane protein YjgN (DUF898 family)
MDTKPLTAPPVPADTVRYAMRFEGSTGEYFKIWIVNLALTIVTFGVFSAWAKVRSKRYFYGNTYIADQAFDYHASPWRILLGRLIGVILLGGYSLTSAFAPRAVGFWALLFVIALPWLIKSSLRFSARNTSYRNLRFDFHGSYWGALKAFVLWQVLAVITLFTTLPFAHRARDYYNINNHSYGQTRFHAKIPVGGLYKIYLLALALVFGILIIALMANSVLWVATGAAKTAFMTSVATTSISIYVLAFLALPPAIGALTFNLALGNTRLSDDILFESRLSAPRMSWIVISNLLATVVSLGLLYPWARIRMAHYRASCITVISSTDIGEFTAPLVKSGNAVGEEIASFFDIDFGI